MFKGEIVMNKINILLVEDDLPLTMGIEYTLKNEGFHVEKAENIKMAKNLLNNEIDLIILDVMLPDGSGYDFCKFVREKLNTPIIFLTACDEEANVVLGLDIGADDYITKPFRVKELLSRIKAVLRRHNLNKKINNSVLISGDIKFDTLQAKVIKHEHEIILTSVEYKLLLVFMKNSMQVLTRNQILENLWDSSGDFVDDNTLSVYVRRLREKIENNAADPNYIITLRGVGYKWNIPVETSKAALLD